MVQSFRLIPLTDSDLRMPVVDGIEATVRIRAAGAAQVLVVTTFGADENVVDALRAGAGGFLLTDAHPAAVRRGRGARSTTRAPGRLTPRERVVLQLVASGLTDQEIADRLIVSEAMVESHVGHPFTELDVRDRVQAVVFAYGAGPVGSDQFRSSPGWERRAGRRGAGAGDPVRGAEPGREAASHREPRSPPALASRQHSDPS